MMTCTYYNPTIMNNFTNNNITNKNTNMNNCKTIAFTKKAFQIIGQTASDEMINSIAFAIAQFIEGNYYCTAPGIPKPMCRFPTTTKCVVAAVDGSDSTSGSSSLLHRLRWFLLLRSLSLPSSQLQSWHFSEETSKDSPSTSEESGSFLPIPQALCCHQ